MAALRTARETAERLILTAATSAVAADMDQDEVVAWLKGENLWRRATPAEKAFLSDPRPSQKTTIYFSWQMEAVYVLGWALRLVPALGAPTSQASIGDILERMPGPGDRVEEFFSSCALRPAAEIRAAAEAALNAHASCRSAKSAGKSEPHGYDIEVAQERHRALNWLVRYENAEWDDVPTDT